MSDLKSLTTTFRQKRALHNAFHEQNEKKHNKSYNELCDCLKKLKDDTIGKSQSLIVKHLNTLMANKHVICNLAYESKTLVGLPVPNEYQREILNFMSDISNFTNKIHDMHKSSDSKDSIDSVILCEEVNNFTQNIKNEMKKVKNTVNQAETLYSNVKTIDEYSELDDEPGSFNGSIIFDE